MANLLELIKNARNNVPKLNIPVKSNDDEIVLYEEKNIIFEKFKKHWKRDFLVNEKEQSKLSWLQVKEDMLMKIEKEKDQEWQKQKLIQLADEEELFEDDDESNINDAENSENEDDEPEILNTNDQDDEPEILNENDQEDEPEILNENDQDDEPEILSNKNENAQTKALVGVYEMDIDDEDCIFSVKKNKIINIVDDDDDIEESQNVHDTNFFDNQTPNEILENINNFADIGEYKFVSQNFLQTQSNSDKKCSNEENYDSQMLLELCSGKFEDTIYPNSAVPNTSNKDDVDDNESIIIENDNVEEENLNDDNDEENEEVLNDDNDEEALNVDSDEENDEEALNVDSDEENDEEALNVDSDEEKIYSRNRNRKISTKDFFEDEAELSGDDEVSSDESEDEEDREFIDDLVDHNSQLDNDDVREQVEKIYNKNMLNEDKRQMMILKELYFEDGDLYDDTKRKKKFKWNFEQTNLSELINVVPDSDDNDSIIVSSDEENKDDDDDWKMKKCIGIKRPVEELVEDSDDSDNNDNDNDDNKDNDNNVNSLNDLNMKRMNTLLAKPKKKNQSSLASFVIRDERFKDIIKCNNRTSTKKFKANNCSIFDFI